MSKPMPVKPLTVADLIDHLRTLPQGLPVCYSIFSEQCLLDVNTMKIESLCMPRPDGWVANKRSDKPSIDYLVLC